MIKNAFIHFNSFLLHSFVFRTKYNITMKTIKSILIILLAILPIWGHAMADDYEITEIKLHASVPPESIRRAPQRCVIRCLYNPVDNSMLISADNMDYSGTMITVTNITNNTIEYSCTTSSSFLYEAFPLSGTGLFYIEIILPSGQVYSGSLSAF